jgi:transcriptional regulator with XRE-family HTH domain
VARRADDIRVRFGARVRELRLQRGMSQEALGVAAGMHRTYVGGIELGLRNPSLKNIASLARALHVTLGELFERL